jgi:hypothetical protein
MVSENGMVKHQKFFTISSTEKYEPTILGLFHLWEKRRDQAVHAADVASNNGHGLL